MYSYALDGNDLFNQGVKKIIMEQGIVSVEQMQKIALYHEQFGYYNTKSVLGGAGDFITAPEISQLFGDLIGLWCIAQWQMANCPKSIHLIELGPGKGTLMNDILQISSKRKDFLDSLTISMVEICPYLRNIQKQSLPYDFIYWYSDLTNVPKGADFTIIIANEFFDALPIKQFVGSDERCVKYNETEDKLFFYPSSSPKTVKEYSSLEIELMNTINQFIKPGAALIIDYGDDTQTESRFGDTLQAVYKHKKIDVLDSLGFADLSHQVDFYQLKNLASNHRMQTQAEFLLNLGIEERLNKLMNIADKKQQFNLMTGATRLIAPTEMGNKFKVLEIFNY